MPVDPPAVSTPPTDPDPSPAPPSIPRPPSPPELHAEAIWRQTFLAQLSSPHDRETLERLGDLLYNMTLEAGCLGGGDRRFAAEELDAVADDLEQLAAALREISEAPADGGVGPEDRELCGEAKDWEKRLRDLAREMRRRVREVEGEPAPEHTPATDDIPLGQDLRIADRIARRLADHHPAPEVRRIYRQLVEHVESKREGRS